MKYLLRLFVENYLLSNLCLKELMLTSNVWFKSNNNCQKNKQYQSSKFSRNPRMEYFRSYQFDRSFFHETSFRVLKKKNDINDKIEDQGHADLFLWQSVKCLTNKIVFLPETNENAS